MNKRIKSPEEILRDHFQCELISQVKDFFSGDENIVLQTVLQAIEAYHSQFILSREELIKKICDWLEIPCKEKAIADHSVEELADALMGYISVDEKTRQGAMEVIMHFRDLPNITTFYSQEAEEIVDTLISAGYIREPNNDLLNAKLEAATLRGELIGTLKVILMSKEITDENRILIKKRIKELEIKQ